MSPRSVARRLRLIAFLAVLAPAAMASAQLPTPLIRYTFDEASSGTVPAADSGLAPQAAGSFVNATRTADTPAGASRGALDLSTGGAGNRYLTTGAGNSKTDNKDALTATAWINLRAAPAQGDVIVSDMADGFGGQLEGGWAFRLFAPRDNSAINAGNVGLGLTLSAYDGSGGQIWNYNSLPVRNADHQWAFVAMAYQQGFDGKALFYAGSAEAAPTLIDERTIDLGVNHFSNTHDLRVGGHSGEPTVDYAPPAWIDDVRVYNGVLTAAQLNEVRLQNVPEPASLAAALALLGAAAVTRRRTSHRA